MKPIQWSMSWDERHHRTAIHLNNQVSLDWFFLLLKNNPPAKPPKNNPDEIDDFIASVRRELEDEPKTK